jgi:serine/threonine protein phosphatase PrpC
MDGTVLQRSRQTLFDDKAIIVSDIGLLRTENQDRVAALRVSDGPRPFVCFALSDGMGGMKDGGPCATVTVAAFFSSLIAASELEPQQRLHMSTNVANEAVYKQWQGRGGATLSAILIEDGNSVYVSNVGDSRVYALNAEWTKLTRLTVDDNLKEAFGGADRGLVQFIGIGNSLVPNVQHVPAGFDSFFITSDGTHYFDERIFEQLLLHATEPLRATDRLLALARWLGGPDNASVAALTLSNLLNKLDRESGSLPTVWSGNSQLHLQRIRDRTPSTEPPLSQTANERDRPNATKQRTATKRKIKIAKKTAPESQLEIKISSDEGEDASDS